MPRYLLLVIFLFCIKPVSSFAQSEPTLPEKIKVKVGCLFPYTGSAGLYGRDSVEAMELAISDIKAKNDPSYPDIELLIGDTRSRTLRAVQIARRFIQEDNVDFLCGVVSSQIAIAVTKIALRKEVFFIGTDHASPSLVSEELHPYYFRVNNGTRQSMAAGARYIATTYGKSNTRTGKVLNVAFIGPDYDYGYQAWVDLNNFLRAEGVNINIVGEFWPRLFDQDYSIYIQEIIKTNPDIVINGQWGQDLVTFIKQAQSFGLLESTTLMNFDAGGNFETLSALGDDMPLGLVLSARHHVNWPDTAINRHFVTRFFERVGRYPSYAAEGAYSGIVSIAEVVRSTGSVSDKRAIRQAFENLVIKLPEDPEGFSSRMDPISHQMLQAQAIGKTVRNEHFPPAKVLLDDWFISFPDKHWPIFSAGKE